MADQMRLAPMVRAGFGITLFLMTGIGISSWIVMRKLNETNQWVNHTHEVIGNLKGLEKSMVDAETGQRGFAVTNQENFLEPYFAGQQEVNNLVTEIRDLTSDNPTQQNNIDDLEKLIDTTLTELEDRIQLTRQGREEELLARYATGDGKRKMDEVRAAIADMVKLEEDLLVDRSSTTANISTLAKWVIVGGTSSAVFLGIITLVFIGRKVIQPVNLATGQLSSSSGEIASAIEQQEETIKNQAAITTQTSTTMEELSVSSRQSAEQAEAAASGAQEALILSEEGSKAVEQTLEGMSNLQDKVTAIANEILRLSEQTSEIGSISDLVSNLANQTNMLALNAAVEAVRAGEHGKGFGVVAGEIRKLADQSKNSAEKINDRVNEIQNAINSTVIATDEGTKTVKEGLRIAQETAQAFSGVSNSVNNIVSNSQQISLNVKQQDSAIQEVLTSMASLNQMAQENASGISQVKDGTHRLNDVAVQLKTII